MGEDQEVDLPQAQLMGIESAPDATFGVSIELLDITLSPSETALQVEIKGAPESWMVQCYLLHSSLEDDLGNQYPVIYGPTRGKNKEDLYLITF